MDPAAGITRRRALGLLASATAVTACSSSTSRPPSPGTTSAGSATAGPRPPAVARAADWAALRRKLHGSVHRRGSAGYDQARLLFDRRFDGLMPTAVARVASESDISHCLAFAQRFGLPVRVRSGGHSYIGASSGTGLVIDVRRLAAISVNSGASTATMGAGVALVDAYSALAAKGVGIPAGSCPSVGLSGLTLGGGAGVLARSHGLTCDSLVEARVVTADGSVQVCNPTNNKDLYWALRGGGGSFGVVTSLTLNTFPATLLSHAYLAWPWSAAADVLAAWQQWGPAAPHALWSTCHLLATDISGSPTVSVAAVSLQGTASLQQHIGALTQQVSTAPTTNFVSSESYAATMMLEAGCSQLTVQACHVAAETPGGTLPRDAFVAGSDYFTHPIPPPGVTALVNAVAARQADPRLGTGGAAFDILGGAIDQVPAADAAWSHRGALFGAQYTASWGTASSNRPLARNQHSLAKIHNSVRHYARGDAYQNYADDSLANPQEAYYGSNLARLIEVRRTYDPGGTFSQPQGVPLQ